MLIERVLGSKTFYAGAMLALIVAKWMMAHRDPTPEEEARAKERIASAARDEYGRVESPTIEERMDMLQYIIGSDFDREYKVAARDLLAFYSSFFTARQLEIASPETRATIRKAVREYRRLPIRRRAEVESGVSVSTIKRYMSAKATTPRPLTEIKLAITLGLPCLWISDSGEAGSSDSSASLRHP